MCARGVDGVDAQAAATAATASGLAGGPYAALREEQDPAPLADVDDQSLGPVVPGVLVARHDNQVHRAVVARIMVYVMHHGLSRVQLAPQQVAAEQPAPIGRGPLAEVDIQTRRATAPERSGQAVPARFDQVEPLIV